MNLETHINKQLEEFDKELDKLATYIQGRAIARKFITQAIKDTARITYENHEQIISKKRQELWRFYHECQEWSTQKQSVQPLDEILKEMQDNFIKFTGGQNEPR